MANENNNKTPTQRLAASLTTVLGEFWNEALATFATKQGASADRASVAEGIAAIAELT